MKTIKLAILGKIKKVQLVYLLHTGGQGMEDGSLLAKISTLLSRKKHPL